MAYGSYKVHPVAELFPLLEGEEFDGLAADFEAHGLLQPIGLDPDKKTLVDGRNRFLACQSVGVKPVFKVLGSDYDEDMIMDYIASANVHRRHLSIGQLGAIAVELRERFAVEAKKRQQDHGGTAPGRRATLGSQSFEVKGRSAEQAARPWEWGRQR
jgi:ParB-like nuclease domain